MDENGRFNFEAIIFRYLKHVIDIRTSNSCKLYFQSETLNCK